MSLLRKGSLSRRVVPECNPLGVILVDSCTVSNPATNNQGMPAVHPAPSRISAIGQTFRPTSDYLLARCSFQLAKVGSPVGHMIARLYSHTGTFGSTGLPDAILASSKLVNMNVLTSSFQIITFTFSAYPCHKMSSLTPYVIVLEIHDATVISITDYVIIGVRDMSHVGNKVRWNTGIWIASPSLDASFYLYGAPV